MAARATIMIRLELERLSLNKTFCSTRALKHHRRLSLRNMSSSRPKKFKTVSKASSSTSTGIQTAGLHTSSSRAPKKSSHYRPAPSENLLLLPSPPSLSSVVDTHTHVARTYELYRENYRGGKYADVYDFVQTMYKNRNIEALVDIWCEAPVRKMWKEFADAAVDEKEKKWGNIQYWFALGTLLRDSLQTSDLTAHARCAPVSIISTSSLFFWLIPVHKVMMRKCTTIALTKTCACPSTLSPSLYIDFLSQFGGYETPSMRSPWGDRTRLPLYPLSPPSSTKCFHSSTPKCRSAGKTFSHSYARSR